MDHPAPPPATKKRSGCVTALLVVGGLGALLALLLVGGGVWFVNSERGEAVLGALGEAADTMVALTTAPGTTELMQAGCQTAMVGTMREILSMAELFMPDDTLEQLERDGEADALFVMCEPAPGSPVDCPRVATTYAAAVPDAPARFAVGVRRGGRDVCQGYYAPDGTRLGDLDDETGAFVPEHTPDAPTAPETLP